MSAMFTPIECGASDASISPSPRKDLTVKSMGRGLDLHLLATGKSLSAHLLKGDTSLAFRFGSLKNSRIHLEDSKACLWVEEAAFDVPLHQVHLIVSTFGIEAIDGRKEKK
jgi:hypothetical protein